MVMKILTNLDLNKNQILNVRLQQLASAPANPVKGQIYFNTTDNRAFIYNGTEWVGADSLGAQMTGEAIVAAINNSSSIIADDNLSENVNNALTKLSGIADGATKAESSAINGNIKINGSETTVYTHPAKHSISDVDGLQSALDSVEDNAKDYADSKIADLVGSAPEALDTLYELANALGENPNFATTVTNELAKKTNKFTQAVGNGSDTSIVVTHNLNTRDVVVMIRETASPYAQVIADVEMTTVNTVTLKFATAPTNGEYTVTIIG